MQSFPLFPRLPQELQDMIWNFAVRHPPTLHFFRQANSGGGLVLEAPRCDPQAQPSWTENNSSFYVYYKALSSTCRASRRAVEKYRQGPMILSLSSTNEDNTALRHVFWNRRQDVVCLQPPAYNFRDFPDLSECWALGGKNNIKYIPQFAKHWDPSETPARFLLAIQYYSSWSEQDEEQFTHLGFRWARCLAFTMERNPDCGPSLFIIDTCREPRLDHRSSASSRRPVFESTTHYYFKAERSNDELFEDSAEDVYWFADDLWESLAISSRDGGVYTEIHVVAAFPKTEAH
ncbi:hypothetical protein F5Y13DRAFT_203870 [Hypoxylon sp. FL1857]|nr:hypothetical protein F5Y13DRAFT_203870 [Hypoxylon sp. FL1857]